MEIDKVYEPQRFEPHWAEQWVSSQQFRANAEPGKPYFSLAIPPPNVTGSLHMGHMFEHSIIDALIRWRRMTGVNTLWLPGTDHAGIATQLVVERELSKRQLSRVGLGREGEQVRAPRGAEHRRDRVASLVQRERRAAGEALGGGERLDLRQAVDEDAVALVGGDATRAGVRLGDEPLILEGSHIVADGGRTHPKGMTFDEGTRTYRLMGGHIVLNNRSQNCESTILCHSPS